MANHKLKYKQQVMEAELLKEKVTANDEILLREMVRQNILYFDPTKAKYYPQGKSYHHGIKLYFQK